MSSNAKSQAEPDPKTAVMLAHVFLGLMKTCQKLGVSFFDYLGYRLDVQGARKAPPLQELVLTAKA